MSAKLISCFLTLSAVVLVQGCSRTPTDKAATTIGSHHLTDLSQDWIIELPETATSQEIISNYFTVLLFQDGKPVLNDRVTMLDTSGKMVAQLTNSVQKVSRYNIVKEQSAYCGGGVFTTFVIDTDLGRKRVRIELARNHSQATTGWRCSLEDEPTDATPRGATGYAQP